jgi:hypothetical protein
MFFSQININESVTILKLIYFQRVERFTQPHVSLLLFILKVAVGRLRQQVNK